jgi:hypothetical protein
MTIFGLHLLDWAIVLLYFGFVFYVGKKTNSAVKDQEHLFIAGRKLNKVYQFLLTLGEMTEANNAITVTSAVSRQAESASRNQIPVPEMSPRTLFHHEIEINTRSNQGRMGFLKGHQSVDAFSIAVPCPYGIREYQFVQACRWSSLELISLSAEASSLPRSRI